jgi:DNA (cytosine-5)-methyltransferase 1
LIPEVEPWPAEIALTLNAAFGEKLGLEDQHINGGAGLFVLGERVAGAEHAKRVDGAERSQIGIGTTLSCNHEAPIVFKPSHYTRDKDGAPIEVAAPLSAEADRGDQEQVVLAFTAGNLSRGAGPTPSQELCPTLKSDHGRGNSDQQTLIAFSCKDHGAAAGEINPTLRSMGHDGSHANAGGQVAVAFTENQRNEVREMDVAGALPTIRRGDAKNETLLAVGFNARQDPDSWDDRTGPLDVDGTTQAVCFESRIARNGRGGPSELVPPLKAQSGESGKGDAAPLVATPEMSVRRLTPRECERLQGFPDDYTAIPYRGKPAADGPRYKALGNSKAVPVVRWIGRRIERVLTQLTIKKQNHGG